MADADAFNLQDELQSLADPATYQFPHEHDLAAEPPAAARTLLAEVLPALSASPESITDPITFDTFRSVLKYADVVPGPVMSMLLDSILEGLAGVVEGVLRDEEGYRVGDREGGMEEKRAPLEMYAFLLQWFVSAAEKVKAPTAAAAGDDGDANASPVAPRVRKGRKTAGGGTAAAAATARTPAAAKKKEAWSWVDQIPATLTVICKTLRIKTHRIWTTSPERDVFITCITRPAYHISESESYMKHTPTKLLFYKLLSLAIKHHSHALHAQISILQSLQYYEHLAEPMAELLGVLAKEFDYAQLGDEVLREVGGRVFGGGDTRGPRAFSRFLVRFSEICPRGVLKQLSLLLAHLDSESYPMRMAMVEVIGNLIRELASQDPSSSSTTTTSTTTPSDPTSSQTTPPKKQLTQLYTLLLSRTLDLSSYVRARTLSVLTKLCDLPLKFPAQRLAMTRAAVEMLEDKAAGVRKGAVGLLGRLVVSHPWGLMHGGLLGLGEWEERYARVRGELEGVEGAVGVGVEEEEEGEQEGVKTEDGMDVHDQGGDTEVEDDSDSDHEEEDDADEEMTEGPSMSIDSEAGTPLTTPTKKPKKKKKKSKKNPSSFKPRKSSLNLESLKTLTNEQAALAALESNQILHLRLRKKYYAEGLNFIRMVEGAMDILTQLLGSTNKAEVLEAMEFFRIAWEYQFDSAELGIKKMLHLIWSKDNNSSTSEDGKELKGVRSRLLECYRSLYFDPLPDMEPKQQVNRIAKNMIELTYDATLAELTSLEEMMRSMMDDGQIHQDVIAKLWQVYSSDKQLPKPQRRGAIIILGMLALARRSVVTERVDTLLRVGLGPLGKADLTLARYTGLALQRLNGSAKKVKGSLLDKTLRIEMDNPIFRKLQDAVEHSCRSKDWFGMAEQAINTIYALGEHPDELCNTMIKNLTRRAFMPRPKAAASDPDAMDEDQPVGDRSVDKTEDGDVTMTQDGSVQDEKEKDVGDVFELSQLLFVVGHVAIKHIVFLELVEREWKRQKDEKTAGDKQAAANSPNRAAKDGEELDQVAGNAEDEIGDRIAGVRETELLYGPESLLAIYGPMLVHICGSPHKFKNRTLRAAATLSFSKFLCVSSQFCDQHHRLLFKILETSKDPNIRSNIVIALGDVAVSFSNIVDENSNELYKGLSDGDLVVKKNTLMVLTHLILNGMIKVKGQLGEMAKCLEDPEPRIADLAKLFFTELSTKENAIYNNLPDVISHLSIGDHAVDEEAFQSTMRYIFSFIEKEKQAENIVEKLCQRFRLSEDPRQWRDIAFCLSLLPFKSERSVKKLIEGLQFYRDKLHEETVFIRFTEILAKARSNKSANKPDTELNEFEAILEEHKTQGAEDQALEKRVEGKKAAAKKRATKRTARKKQATPVEDEDDDMYL